MNNPNSPNFEQLSRAVNNFAKATTLALAPLIKAASEFAERFAVVMRSEYEKAGMPYGDSHDGMMRWLDEVCAAQRLKNEAQEIEERHWFLADTRKQLQNFSRR